MNIDTTHLVGRSRYRAIVRSGPVKSMLGPMVAWAEAKPRRRRALSRAMARYYRWRGANQRILDEALSQAADLPLPATRSTMRWAAAVAGGAKMPVGFRPDRRLVSPESRQLGVELLEQAMQRDDNPTLGHHRSYLLGETGPESRELRDFVRADLEKRLLARSTRAPLDLALDPQAGFETLCELCDVLANAGMRPFLVSGTLLGAVREGALLKHDYDLDIGLLPGDGSAADAAEALAGISRIVLNVEEWRVWGTHRSGVAFDIFVHYETDGRYYHATRTHTWWNSPFDLVEIELGGRKFLIPDNSDTYLTQNYGDWRSPTAFYHKSFDTPNREYTDSTDALLYLYELMVDSLKPGGDRFVCESAARELAHNFDLDLTHYFAESTLLDPSADITRSKGN